MVFQLTVLGDGIVANDPATGSQVILSYDPESKTIGGIQSVFDPKINGFVSVDAANATKIAGDVDLPDGGLAALHSFAPAAISRSPCIERSRFAAKAVATAVGLARSTRPVKATG